MREVGLRQSSLDPCVWLPPVSDTAAVGCSVLVYVDDFKKAMNKHFEDTYWKPLTKLLEFKDTEKDEFLYLGMQQSYSGGEARFSQSDFIDRIKP